MLLLWAFEVIIVFLYVPCLALWIMCALRCVRTHTVNTVHTTLGSLRFSSLCCRDKILQLLLSNSKTCHYPIGSLCVYTNCCLAGGSSILFPGEIFSVIQVLNGCLMHGTAQSNRQCRLFGAWPHCQGGTPHGLTVPLLLSCSLLQSCQHCPHRGHCSWPPCVLILLCLKWWTLAAPGSKCAESDLQSQGNLAISL